MCTGGAGFAQSSQSLHAAAKAGPAVSIGAGAGCSTLGGVLPRGTTIGSSCAAAAAIASLANIAGAVDVDDAAGRRCRRVDCQPADHLCDLVRRGDTAEWNVGDDLRTASALQIFLGRV